MGKSLCFSVVVVTVNVNHRSSPLIGGGGTSPVIYTGYIVSCEKMCSGVNWFRTSTRCVYVYEYGFFQVDTACDFLDFSGKVHAIRRLQQKVFHRSDEEINLQFNVC